MKKSALIKIISIVFILLVIGVGCNVITDPNPLIGSYKIVVAEGGYSYAFTLRADGTYALIEYVESAGYVTSGTYTVSLASFDFENATGSIRFRVEEQSTGLNSSDYRFTSGVENVYGFSWSADKSSAERVLRLTPSKGSSGKAFPEDAVTMDDEAFVAQLEKWSSVEEAGV